MPKVSILVPVYNVEKYIERCAISLFEQTFDDIEYVFVNDCTQDNSVELLERIVEKYPHRKCNTYIINNDTNLGIAGVRNILLEKATGDFFLFIDSDDYIEINAIEELYKLAIKDNADVVVCDYFLEWQNTRKFVRQNWDENKLVFINKILSVESMPALWNKLFRRTLYIDNSIQTIEGVNVGEDLLIVPKLIYYAEKISKVQKPLIHYIQTNTSSYTKIYNKKNIDNVILVLNKLTEFFQLNAEYAYSLNKSILRGKIKKKIELVFNSPNQYWEELFAIFPEISDVEDLHFLNKRERVIYFFIKNRMYRELLLYKKFYYLIFNMVQKLKGR